MLHIQPFSPLDKTYVERPQLCSTLKHAETGIVVEKTETKGPRKDATLGLRITQETKQALAAKAAEIGRPMSFVAEQWLDAASKGQVDMWDRLGKGGVAEALLAMAAFAVDVRGEIGDPERKLEARDALLAGWSHLISSALPFTPDSTEGVEARMARVASRLNANLLLEAILEEPLEGEGAMSEEESQWAFRPATITNALNPLAQAGKAPVRLLLDYQGAAGETVPYTGMALIACLRSAPSSLARFSPSPEDVAATIQTSLDRMAAYMAPRQNARRKGIALAQTRARLDDVG